MSQVLISPLIKTLEVGQSISFTWTAIGVGESEGRDVLVNEVVTRTAEDEYLDGSSGDVENLDTMINLYEYMTTEDYLVHP